MTILALLIAVCLFWLFVGYTVGLNERSLEVRTERKARFCAEQRATNAINQLRCAEQHLERLTSLAGGPGRARANRHGGQTAETPAPLGLPAGVHVIPQHPTSRQTERTHA